MRIPFFNNSNTAKKKSKKSNRSSPLSDEVMEEHNQRIARQEAERHEREIEYKEQHRKAEKAKSRILSKCRKARKREYEGWLADYRDQGGEITHSYNYPWERWDWYVVSKGETVTIDEEICGATSFQLIVPEDADFEEESFSHVKVYYWDNGKAKKNDNATVPTFNDLGR